MSESLKSLIASGTKLWLDSIDPDLVRDSYRLGASGATSNPIIVADLLKTGRFDQDMESLFDGHDDEDVAWQMADRLVRDAQDVFHGVWRESGGNNGYVSFELDPLLEDVDLGPSHDERVRQYIELGQQWSAGHDNRMIKVPATAAGLDAVEDLVAAGVTVNVTLVFTLDQYLKARDAVWRGAQRRGDLSQFKSVYSIFVSRVDVYTDQELKDLSDGAQGQVGIVNAKRIWRENRDFWQQHPTPLNQEIIFASTGVKNPSEAPWKYVEAFAGADIQTNPPATNQAVADSGRTFTSQVEQMPAQDVLDEIDHKVDFQRLHDVLMQQGIAKFADPQKKLLELIREKRAALTA